MVNCISAHEVVRFSADQASMCVRHVGLCADRVVVSLWGPQQDLWELLQTSDHVRLTRFPSLRPISFDGPSGARSTATIPPALLERVLKTHRLAILEMIRDQIDHLADQRVGVAKPNGVHSHHDVAVAEDRLEEVRAAAGRLFPEDFALCGGSYAPSRHSSDWVWRSTAPMLLPWMGSSTRRPANRKAGSGEGPPRMRDKNRRCAGAVQGTPRGPTVAKPALREAPVPLLSLWTARRIARL